VTIRNVLRSICSSGHHADGSTSWNLHYHCSRSCSGYGPGRSSSDNYRCFLAFP